MKKIGSLLFLALTVLATAQTPTLEGTRGRGVATTSDARVGHFRFEIARATREDQSRLRGTFVFAQAGRPGTDVRAVEIRMENPAELRVAAPRASFSGRAVMIVPTGPTTFRRLPGRLHVIVSDTKKPTDAIGTTPDTIALKFTNAEAEVSFEFSGRVREGDLVVSSR